MPTTESFTGDVRVFLSRRLIERVVRNLGMGKVFDQSQSWEGYNRACESWHAGYWKWVDQQSPAEFIENLNQAGDWSKLSVARAVEMLTSTGMDCSKLPAVENDKKLWLAEFARHEMLQHHVSFSLAMRGPDAKDPETYKHFANDMKIAMQIGDNTYFEALARQKQRKPSKGKGDRMLKPQLLLCWIPGCLWAFTTDGIAQFLNHHYPRSGNKPYDHKTISDARRALNLYRSPRPLWWGIEGTPASLKPLR
jgi:hypothetical protein